MLALRITSSRTLMSLLLTGDAFDIFLLESASVTTAVTYSIDGCLKRQFYEKEQQDGVEVPELKYEYMPWKELRDLCFSLIKGKNTPLSFRFNLLLKPEHMTGLYQKKLPDADISQLKALLLMIRFEKGIARITTGVSYKNFTLDKEPETVWDQTISKYLSDRGILFEEQ